MNTVFYQLDHNFINIATLIIFSATYAGIAIGRIWGLKLDRTGIILLGAIAMLALGCITLSDAVKSVSFPSILLLFSLMLIASQLHFAGFYHQVARKISEYLDKPALFLALLMIVSGLLSAFLNNDVICFAFTPVVATSLLKKRMNPLPFLIALALSSNIGCALTLIGNAQDVLVGQVARLSFGGYMLWVSIPVLLSMTVAYLTVYFLGKKHFFLPKDSDLKTPPEDTTPMDTWRTIKGVGIICIIIILFFTPLPRYLVALTAAGLLLCSHRLESRKVLEGVDWQLLVLFMALFVVVGAFNERGLALEGVKWLKSAGVDLRNPYILALTTGFLSNLINNSATVMLLVKVVDLSNPVNGYILALSNTFAGNLFLVGSVANIIVVQEAAKYGIKISFKDFAKFGVPTALASFMILLAWIFLMTQI
jgi:Na+/H+ antiporter NhaD/arsenite permease-like protein